MIKIATVCSGIGSPEFAINDLGIEHEIVFGCEIDKYARASYKAIYGNVPMYEDMTKQEWNDPNQYSDLFIGGIPCQSFSLAGKRLGELDPRGLLFFDFYRYVKNQQPKVFIIENVKGLLSDAGGKTFSNWLHLLGNSVNGHIQMFNHADSLGYNLHHTVLNTKNFGLPQNRERVFIVGIRADLPNTFSFPKGWPLKLRLKDVLETSVDEKYYLSDKMLENLITYNKRQVENGTGFSAKFRDVETTEIMDTIKIGGGGKDDLIQVKEATKQGYAIAEPGDSINLSNPNSETRRGRVGKQIANTLDTACNQAVVEPLLVRFSRTDEAKQERRKTGTNSFQDKKIEFVKSDVSNTITTVQKDNLIVEPQLKQVMQLPGKHEATGRVYDANGLCPTITAKQGGGHEPKTITQSRIRRLLPIECWRLQGFPDEAFYKAKAVNSDSQLYKQAGNSISTPVIKAIIENLIHLL